MLVDEISEAFQHHPCSSMIVGFLVFPSPQKIKRSKKTPEENFEVEQTHFHQNTDELFSTMQFYIKNVHFSQSACFFETHLGGL